MATPSDIDDWDERKDRIIGLGERSFRKSYYPQLRQNLDRLERFRTLLDRTTDYVVQWSCLKVPSPTPMRRWDCWSARLPMH